MPKIHSFAVGSLFSDSLLALSLYVCVSSHHLLASDTAHLSWHDTQTLKLSLPYLEFAHQGTTQAYQADLYSSDLSCFVLDVASIALRDLAPAYQVLQRTGHTNTTLAGKTYLIGGEHLQKNGITVPTPVLEIFDTANQQWSLGSPLPHPHFNHHTLVIRDKLYVIGGAQDSFYSLNIRFAMPSTLMDVYDPSLDSWEASITLPNTNPVLAIADDKALYLLGVLHVSAGATGPFVWFTQEVYRYDLESHLWQTLTDMPIVLSAPGAARAEIQNGELYVVSRDWDATAQDDVDNMVFRYDSSSQTWGSP